MFCLFGDDATMSRSLVNPRANGSGASGRGGGQKTNNSTAPAQATSAALRTNRANTYTRATTTAVWNIHRIGTFIRSGASGHPARDARAATNHVDAKAI